MYKGSIIMPFFSNICFIYIIIPHSLVDHLVQNEVLQPTFFTPNQKKKNEKRIVITHFPF